MQTTTVRLYEIIADATMRLDAKYWIQKKQNEYEENLKTILEDEYGFILSEPESYLGKNFKESFRLSGYNQTPSRFRSAVESYENCKVRLENNQYKNKGTKQKDLNKIKFYEKRIFIYKFFAKFVLDSKGIIIKII
jgi:hypothetical protein